MTIIVTVPDDLVKTFECACPGGVQAVFRQFLLNTLAAYECPKAKQAAANEAYATAEKQAAEITLEIKPT